MVERFQDNTNPEKRHYNFKRRTCCKLRREHERSGFLEGIKFGIQLLTEFVEE